MNKIVPLAQLRDRLKARAAVLKAIQQHGYRDGLAEIAFGFEAAGTVLVGWFRDLGGQTYRFRWSRQSLSYLQTQTLPQYPERLKIPSAKLQQIRRKMPAPTKAALSDRGSFACGVGRVNRNRACILSSAALSNAHADLLRRF